MLHSVRQYCIQVLALFGLFVGAATIHPLVHTHAPGQTGCAHSHGADGHSHDSHNHGPSNNTPKSHGEELPCDLNEAIASLALYTPVAMVNVQLVSVGVARVTSLPATTRGAWGTFGGRGPPTSIS